MNKFKIFTVIIVLFFNLISIGPIFAGQLLNNWQDPNIYRPLPVLLCHGYAGGSPHKWSPMTGFGKVYTKNSLGWVTGIVDTDDLNKLQGYFSKYYLGGRNDAILTEDFIQPTSDNPKDLNYIKTNFSLRYLERIAFNDPNGSVDTYTASDPHLNLYNPQFPYDGWADTFNKTVDKILLNPGSGKTKYATDNDSNEDDKLILIAHSMGGLAVREYLRNHSTEDKIDTVVTIDTPHEGAPLVEIANTAATLNSQSGIRKKIRMGFYTFIDSILEPLGIAKDTERNGPATMDMEPGSAFLITLNAIPKPENVTAYCIWSSDDWGEEERTNPLAFLVGLGEADLVVPVDSQMALNTNWSFDEYFGQKATHGRGPETYEAFKRVLKWLDTKSQVGLAPPVWINTSAVRVEGFVTGEYLPADTKIEIRVYDKNNTLIAVKLGQEDVAGNPIDADGNGEQDPIYLRPFADSDPAPAGFREDVVLNSSLGQYDGFKVEVTVLNPKAQLTNAPEDKVVASYTKEGWVRVSGSMSGDNIVFVESATSQIYTYDPVRGKSTTPIGTFDYNSGTYPRISGYNIVWRNYNSIYVYNPQNGTTLIGTSTQAPLISGDNIVWVDTTTSRKILYRYNIDTTAPTEIDRDGNYSRIESFTLSGDNVIWIKYNSTDIGGCGTSGPFFSTLYKYNNGITTVKEYEEDVDICAPNYNYNSFLGVSGQLQDRDPSKYYAMISGDNIAWVEVTYPPRPPEEGCGPRHADMNTANINLLGNIIGRPSADIGPVLSKDNLAWSGGYQIDANGGIIYDTGEIYLLEDINNLNSIYQITNNNQGENIRKILSDKIIFYTGYGYPYLIYNGITNGISPWGFGGSISGNYDSWYLFRVYNYSMLGIDSWEGLEGSIALSNGNMFAATSDILPTENTPLFRLKRIYNSCDLDLAYSPFGPGFRHNYMIKLRRSDPRGIKQNAGPMVLPTGITLIREDGRSIYFEPRSEVTPNEFIPIVDCEYDSIHENEDRTYIVYKKDGTKYYFDFQMDKHIVYSNSGEAADEDNYGTGKLTKIVYPDLKTIDLTYDADGLLTQVISAAAQISFNYQDMTCNGKNRKRVTSITGPNGEFLSYSYDNKGRLQSVTGLPYYSSITYQYEDESAFTWSQVNPALALSNNITNISYTLPDSSTKSSAYTYDTNGRVIAP